MRTVLIRRIKLILFTLLLTPTVAFAQKLIQSRTDKKLNQLIVSKDFFALKDQYARNESKLNEARKIYYEALCAI